MNSTAQQEPSILRQLASDEAVDPEAARILLNRFFGILLAVSSFMLLFGVAFVFPNKLASAIAIAPLLGITLWAWRINHKGHPRRAASRFAVFIWVLGAVSLFSGLPSSISVFILATAVVLAVVLGVRQGACFALSFLAVWLLYIVLDAHGLAPEKQFSGLPAAAWFHNLIALLVVLLPIPDLIGRLHKANQQLNAQLDEIQQLHARLQEQAIRDGLTGLFNRRYLDETLPLEISRAQRNGYPVSVIMMDIDHFKQINDTYGHPAGDEVIKSLGAIFSQGAREGDMACRYGGEEFVIVLPHMAIEVALARAEKWRSEVEAMRVTYGDLNIRFTVSAGVSACPDHATAHHGLIECADRALYQSKKQGRNRVTRFDHPPHPV